MRDSFYKILVLFFVLLLTLEVKAQIAVGLRESALGNSGVAFTDSSAPSHYNPALLSEKTKSNFSLTGTTLSSFQSETETGDGYTSTKFSPNYISSIQAFDSYVHEFSLVNQLSIDTRISKVITNGTTSANLRSDAYNLLYSMAFRNFPFGFQLGLRINETNTHSSSTTNDGNIATGIDYNLGKRVGHMFVGFGGIHQFTENYRLGYKYETPGIKVYDKTEKVSSYYLYDKTNNLFTTGTPQTDDSVTNSFNTQIITIGHSFSSGVHEFLTDSRFTESSTSKNRYDYFQTFGYKLNFSNKMQFMCGLSHEFETKSNFLSTGYSWQTNSLRSILSAYYANSNDETNMKTFGITFGSEFIY